MMYSIERSYICAVSASFCESKHEFGISDGHFVCSGYWEYGTVTERNDLFVDDTVCNLDVIVCGEYQV